MRSIVFDYMHNDAMFYRAFDTFVSHANATLQKCNVDIYRSLHLFKQCVKHFSYPKSGQNKCKIIVRSTRIL